MHKFHLYASMLILYNLYVCTILYICKILHQICRYMQKYGLRAKNILFCSICKIYEKGDCKRRKPHAVYCVLRYAVLLI